MKGQTSENVIYGPIPLEQRESQTAIRYLRMRINRYQLVSFNQHAGLRSCAESGQAVDLANDSANESCAQTLHRLVDDEALADAAERRCGGRESLSGERRVRCMLGEH